MKIERIMCRRAILMTVTFLGFILLIANFPTVDCTGKEILIGANTNEKENTLAESDDKRKIFVCQLPRSATGETLREYFQQFGDVEEAMIIKGSQQRSKGYGFVIMKEKTGTERALRIQHPTINGKTVNVEAAYDKEKNNYPEAQSNSPKMTTEIISGTKTPMEPKIHSLAVVVKDRRTQESKGYGFVTMKKAEDADKALQNLFPTIDGRITNVNLAAEPWNNAFLASHSNLPIQWPQFPPQHNVPPSSAYRIFETPGGSFIQPGILVPKLAASEIQRSLTSHPSILYQMVESRAQQSRINEGNGQSSGSRRPTYGETTVSSSQSLPHPFNNENMFKYHSVNIANERNNQKNTAIDNDEDIKNSTMEGKKSIEEESEGIATETMEKAFHDEPNFALKAELLDSKKYGEATSLPESSSKVEDRKMSWADMVEEEEKNNKETKKETTKVKENDDKRQIFVGQLPKSTTNETLREYFQKFGQVEKAKVITDPKTQNSLLYGFVTMNKAEDADKALQQNLYPNINGRKVYLRAYEGAKRKNKHFASPSNSPDQLPQLQEGRKKKPNSNIDGRMAEVNSAYSKHFVDLPIGKEDKSFGGNLPVDQNKNDDVHVEAPRKSYLNVAQKSQSASKKEEDVTHSLRTSILKIESEDVIEKKNLADGVEKVERKECDNRDLRRIFVGGVSSQTTDETLQKYFEQFGVVEKAEVKKYRKTGKSQGIGFVTMKKQEDVKRALFNPKPFINGRQMEVKLAEPWTGKSPTGNLAEDPREKVTSKDIISESGKSAQDEMVKFTSEDGISESGKFPNEGSNDNKIAAIKQERNRRKKEKRKAKKADESEKNSSTISLPESPSKALKREFNISKKNVAANWVPKSSSDKIPDESLNIGAKGIEKMLAKKTR